MKTRIALHFVVMSILAFNTCGTTMSIPTDNEPRVQVTFFGASFGDGGENEVMNKMTKNGIGHGWQVGNRETRVIKNVPFAGKEWYAAFIQFTDHKFSRIIFTDRFKNENDALRELDDILELLGKKYELTQETLDGQYTHLYAFKDAIGNSVTASVVKINNLESIPWTCSVTYSWNKAIELREAKALNEI